MSTISEFDRINEGLRKLFAKLGVDPPTIYPNRRLAFAEMELTIYNLSKIVDPVGCRRTYGRFVPARNEQERSRFIEKSVTLINNSQLCPDKVNASRLRMCGGDPFRKLILDLVDKAMRIDDKKREKSMFIERMIPLVNIKQVDWDGPPEQIDLDVLKEILVKYPDPKYDNDKTIALMKKWFDREE